MHRHSLVRLLWCATGVAAGISLALHLAAPPVLAFFLASLGGSSILPFGLTRVPPAQPRALFGGHVGGAAIGIACYQAFADPPLVYAVGQALTLSFMFTTKTIPPSAGRNPIRMVYVHAGWGLLVQPVFLGVTVLAITAALWRRPLSRTCAIHGALFPSAPEYA